MKRKTGILILILLVTAIGLSWDLGGMLSPSRSVLSEAEAVVGRPATTVSYAGVARRSTVGVNTPRNLGGPVNRVGRR